MKTSTLWRALAASLLCVTLAACSDDNNDDNKAMDMGVDTRMLDNDTLDEIPDDAGIFPDTDPTPPEGDAAVFLDMGQVGEDMGNTEDVGEDFGTSPVPDAGVPDVNVSDMR